MTGLDKVCELNNKFIINFQISEYLSANIQSLENNILKLFEILSDEKSKEVVLEL